MSVWIAYLAGVVLAIAWLVVMSARSGWKLVIRYGDEEPLGRWAALVVAAVLAVTWPATLFMAAIGMLKTGRRTDEERDG